jgi:hypothetical protein
MVVEKKVEIPVNHRLVLDVPPEIPAGKAILTFSPEGNLRPSVLADCPARTMTEKSEMRDIERINRNAERLNREALDVLSFQNMEL